MADVAEKDVELKFDGEPITRLGGAPAEYVASSLWALQRMAHLLGMRREGQRFGHKARPNAKVRRTYSIICRAPESGSHVQPFTIASAAGQHTAASAAVRCELLSALRAFDSGDDVQLAEVLPNPRQRWFLADAALGLLPPEESAIEVSIRQGSGRYSFKATRARSTLERLRSGDPPPPELEEVVGKLKALDFTTAHLTIKPTHGRVVRTNYPLVLEPFLQRNVRRRLRLSGMPELSGAGDVIAFSKLESITEVEPLLPKIESFKAGATEIRSVRPYAYLVGYDVDSGLFFVRDPEVGIDVFSDDLDVIEREVRSDLDVLWRNYAQASENELTPEAQALRRNLRARFRGAT